MLALHHYNLPCSQIDFFFLYTESFSFINVMSYRQCYIDGPGVHVTYFNKYIPEE